MTAKQTMKLIYHAESDPLVCLWTLAALTGARKGELLALSWDDVDLDAGQFHIRRSLRSVKAGEPEYTEPKTVRSRRTLDLAPDAVLSLRAHWDRQKFHAGTMWDGWNPHRLVFVSKLGTPLYTDNVTRAFKAALARADLPTATRFHDLRHGAATLMLEAGESVPTVAEYLGHATPAVTMTVYAHAVPGSNKRAAERLGAIFRSAMTPSSEADGDPTYSAGQKTQQRLVQGDTASCVHTIREGHAMLLPDSP
ncbi:MAG: site-specific integrase [Vicinamibacterales bacterium]